MKLLPSYVYEAVMRAEHPSDNWVWTGATGQIPCTNAQDQICAWIGGFWMKDEEHDDLLRRHEELKK